MTKLIIVGLFHFTIASVSWACMTKSTQKNNKSQIQNFILKEKRKPAQAILKFADASPIQSLESKLGNLLLENNAQSIVLSLPASIQKSSFKPFGDGQSNAKLELGSSWKEKDFAVVGLQKIVAGKPERKYVFHPSLGVSDYKETKLSQEWYKVQPTGWNDSFYFSFETSTLTLTNFLAGIPPQFRTFSKDRVAPNLAKIEKGVGPSGFKSLGEGFNSEPWFAANVHGLFPNEKGVKTALGGVLTWGIVDQQYGPFKNLYTCFEARNIEEEKSTGAPSGAGWHLIGDAGESLLNNLEDKSIPVALGRTHSFADAAYGFTESITATWLQTDEVLISQNGHFHWYLNPYQSTVCTEIWVHKCIPSPTNNWGFNCQ